MYYFQKYIIDANTKGADIALDLANAGISLADDQP